MGSIKRLTSQEAIKIAAGEVVERPGNIVKELLENALDANAQNIRISIINGGKTSIRIVDDGCGMDSNDAQLCFEHHATSKITSVEELQQISTFGFRGEALSSIAAVSHVTLLTKQKELAVGTKVIVQHGSIEQVKQQSCPVGTDITIINLFDNIPARKKFLKKKETELRHIQQLIMAYALANTHVSFRLEHNKTRLIQVHGAQSLSERMIQLKEQLSVQNFIELGKTTASDGSSLSGVISNHQTYRYDRSLLFCFVNGRWIKNFQLSNACVRGYSNVLPHGRYPAAALFVTIDPCLIDINVHPRKEEVQFSNPQRICTLITNHVKEALEGHMHSLLSSTQKTTKFGAPLAINTNQAHMTKSATYGLEKLSSVYQIQQDPTHHALVNQPSSKKTTPKSQAITHHKEEPTDSESAQQKSTPEVQSSMQHTTTEKTAPIILGQLLNTYIVIEHTLGLALIDQHAAHERILYEQLSGNFKAAAPIRLLFPEVINLDTVTIQTVETLLPMLHTCGLELELSGATAVVLRSRPAYAQRLNVRDLLLEISAFTHKNGQLQEENVSKKVSWHVHSHMACKAAIRAGDTLSVQRMQGLIEQLFSCPNHLTCPHGRPTMWQLTKNEIERVFKRRT